VGVQNALGATAYDRFQLQLYSKRILVAVERHCGSPFFQERDQYLFKFNNAHGAYRAARALHSLKEYLIEDYPTLRSKKIRLGFKIALDSSRRGEITEGAIDSVPAAKRLKELDDRNFLRRNALLATEEILANLREAEPEDGTRYDEYFGYITKAELDWTHVRLYEYTQDSASVLREHLCTKVIIGNDHVKTLRVLRFTVLEPQLHELDMGPIPQHINSHTPTNSESVITQPNDVVSSIGVPVIEGGRVVVKLTSPLSMGDSSCIALLHVINGDFFNDPEEECYGITWPNTQASQSLEVYFPIGKKLASSNSVNVTECRRVSGAEPYVDNDIHTLSQPHDYRFVPITVKTLNEDQVNGAAFWLPRRKMSLGRLRFEWAWRNEI